MTICDRCGEEFEGPAFINPNHVLENLCGYCNKEVKDEISKINIERNRNIYLKILNNNRLWSNYPILLLERKGGKGNIEHGILLADATPVVYIENGYNICQCNKDVVKFVIKHMEPVKYSDFNSLVDDKWEVNSADIKVLARRVLAS